MSNTNQAGKGDKPRPVKKEVYNDNFDSIKWTSAETPKKPFKTVKGKQVYKY